VTTSNKLDPTTSSILLAKGLAFPSDLNSPIKLHNPSQLHRQGTTNKNRAHGQWSAISGIEKIVLGP